MALICKLHRVTQMITRDERNHMARTKKEVFTHTCTRTGDSHTGTIDELAEFFYRDKSAKSGLSPWTKAAEREYNKAYRAGLDKAKATRKADADAKGVKAFDATMQSMGVRTTRKARKAATSKVATSRAAKKRTTARKAATTGRSRKVA
jgi:hypothetical protein